MKTLLFALAVLLLAVRGQAQTPLPVPIVCHGCPDRVTYRTLEEIPFDSLQSHWSAKGANLYGDVIDVLGFNPKQTVLAPAHVHMECGKPSHIAPPGTTNYARYGEYGGPMHFDCQVVLRDVKGVAWLWGAVPFKTLTTERWYAVVWDDTGSSIQPVMAGDPSAPMGVQVFKFHFVIDPRANWHGWDVIAVGLHVSFDNGDQLDADNLFPYWNNVDPTAPISIGSQGFADHPVWGVFTAPFVNPALNPGDTFGQNISTVENYLPTAPVAGAWTLPPTPNEAATVNPRTIDAQGHGPTFTHGPVAFTNSYGQTVPSTSGSCQVRRDQNFHMEDLSNLGPDGRPVMKGIYGIETSRIDQPQIIPCQGTIDNTGLPVGDHTYAFERFQPENNIQTNAVASLIVIHVPVPDGTVVVPLPEPIPVPTPTPTPTPTPVPTPTPTPLPVLPTIVSVLTCQTVTMSDGSVTSQCVHVP